MAGPVMLVFWLLAFTTQVNLNHFFNMVVGTGWFITAGIALCCIFLFLTVRVPLRRSLGTAGYLYVATIVSYLTIGLCMTTITNADWNMAHYYTPFYAGLAILLTAATALSAAAALPRIGVEKLLAGILAIQTAACIAILLTPFLMNNIYAELGAYRRVASYRAIGTFASPNLAAILACQAVVLALALMESRRYRKYALPAAVVAGAAAFYTFSRTAVVVLVSVGVFFLFVQLRAVAHVRAVRGALLATVFVSAITVGVFMLADPSLVGLQYDRAGLLNRYEVFSSFSLDNLLSMPRLRIWPVAVPLALESPIFGHGMTQFISLDGLALYCVDGLDLSTKACGPHNTYLTFWGEAGIVPLVLSLSFTGFLLRAHLKAPRSVATNAGAGWAIVLALESMAADRTFYTTGNAFIIGLSCAMAGYSIREMRVGGDRRMLERSHVSGLTG